jgi:hypothetical protein
VILRLYLLLPVEEGLLELLVLRLCLFCAGDRGVCLGAKRGEFLFSNVSKVPGYLRGVSAGSREKNAYVSGACLSDLFHGDWGGVVVVKE